MKKTKEYKISKILFIIAISFFLISLVIGLIPNYEYNTDKIFMFLGFAFNGFGFIYLKKAEKNNNDKK